MLIILIDIRLHVLGKYHDGLSNARQATPRTDIPGWIGGGSLELEPLEKRGAEAHAQAIR